MRLFATRKAIALTVVSAITIAGTGIAAFAYWTTTGTGSGSAAAGTSGAVSVTQTSTIAAMYPGGPSRPLQAVHRRGDRLDHQHQERLGRRRRLLGG